MECMVPYRKAVQSNDVQCNASQVAVLKPHDSCQHKDKEDLSGRQVMMWCVCVCVC